MTTKQTQLLNAISRAGEHGLAPLGAQRAIDSNAAGTSRVLNELLRRGMIQQRFEPRRFHLS